MKYFRHERFTVPISLSLCWLPRAPIPKGRLLEIIASLQRASEGQCSNQDELQDEQTEQQTDSLLPLSKHAAAANTTAPISSQAHSHSNTFPELASGGIKEDGRSCATENDVTTFDTHQEQYSEKEDSTLAQLPSAQLPLAQCTVDQALLDTPPMGDSPPPLAPPPPPLAPPPPPPIGAPDLMTTRRVVQYEPSVPLKPLFWKKLQYSALEVRGQDIVWSNTSEPGQQICSGISYTLRNICWTKVSPSLLYYYSYFYITEGQYRKILITAPKNSESHLVLH